MSALTSDAAVQPRALETSDRAPRVRALMRQAELWVPAAFIAFLFLACFLGPVIFSAPSPVSGNIANVNLPLFSPGHILGTDPQGFDELSRLLYGGRISLEVGLGSAALGMAVGGSLGAIAALKGGRVETVIMRCLDVLLAFPAIILAITITAYFGESEAHLIFAIGLVFCAAFGRLARAQTLRLRERPFVLASRLVGQPDRRVLLRHVLPNILPNLVTLGILLCGVAIALEAALSFLGAGVQPPAPSWGNMITLGQSYLGLVPRLVIIPGVALLLTITSFNLLSDAVRARWAQR
jgi:peptide/nickel transport system permease protein